MYYKTTAEKGIFEPLCSLENIVLPSCSCWMQLHVVKKSDPYFTLKTTMCLHVLVLTYIQY